MNDKIKMNIAHQIKAYMRFMTKEKAVEKVKRVHLNRKDSLVNDAAKLV